jgi:DNA-binding NarL/FixJ family response regulator
MKKITVFLCDDHALFREGLRLLLESADDIEVIGEADNGYRAVGETKRLLPDVVLMDVAMPLLNGVEAARRIVSEVPATKVLILSTYSDDQHVQQAIGAGVAGYLMKETASKDLLRAIREAGNGTVYFSPPIAKRLLKQWQNRDPQAKPAPAPSLTGRQTEVVQLIAEGYSTKQIAGLLAISTKTVEKHRQSVMDKLNIHDVASLTRYAVSAGVVDLHPAPDSVKHIPTSAHERALIPTSMAGAYEQNGTESLANSSPAQVHART